MLGIEPKGDGANSVSLKFPNGSRIIWLPGSPATVRGFSKVSMLVIDKAAYMHWAMYTALIPMLAVGGGDLWVMRTPCGKQGLFHQIWAHGGARWERVLARATEYPGRIPADFLEQQRSELGPAAFEQEFMCEFVDAGGQVFAQDMLDRALDESVEPLIFAGNWGSNRGRSDVFRVRMTIWRLRWRWRYGRRGKPAKRNFFGTQRLPGIS